MCGTLLLAKHVEVMKQFKVGRAMGFIVRFTDIFNIKFNTSYYKNYY